MLVITRKCEQEVIIGEHVRLKVLAVRGNRVRLGIVAPRNVPVHRAEHMIDQPAAVDRGVAVEPRAIRVPA